MAISLGRCEAARRQFSSGVKPLRRPLGPSCAAAEARRRARPAFPARIRRPRVGERREPTPVIDAKRLHDVGRHAAEAAREIDRMILFERDQRFLHEAGNLPLEAGPLAADQDTALRFRRHVAAHPRQRAATQSGVLDLVRSLRAVMIARIATGGITDPLPRLLYAQRIAGAQ